MLHSLLRKSSDEARVLEVAPKDNILARVENEVDIFRVRGTRHVVVHLALGILVHLFYFRERTEKQERERQREGWGGLRGAVASFRGFGSRSLVFSSFRERSLLAKSRSNVTFTRKHSFGRAQQWTSSKIEGVGPCERSIRN